MKKFFRKLHNLFRRNRGTFKKGDIIAFPTIDEMRIHSNSGIYSVFASHTHKVKIYKCKTFKLAKLLWLRDLRFSFKYPSHEMRIDNTFLPISTFRRAPEPQQTISAEWFSDAARLEHLIGKQITIKSL